MTAIESLPRDQIEQFCRRWLIRRLELFGSVLRNELKAESDLDCLITFEPAAHWTLFHLVEMESELSSIVGRRADIVIRESVEQSPNYIRRNEILKTAMEYYAA